MITPSASPLNSWIWPVLKSGKNEWHLTRDCYSLEAVVAPNQPLVPVPTIMGTTDPIHSATGTHSAITDLANCGVFSACVNSVLAA